MNYYIDLFSPETAEAFARSDRTVSGFRISQRPYVENKEIGPGDKFICYVTRLQRFIGILEVISEPFVDDTPIFTEPSDAFTLRFKVRPVVWLPLELAIPIRDEKMWANLSFTRDLPKGSNEWTYLVFASPRSWMKEGLEQDAKFIEAKLVEQAAVLKEYPLTEDDKKKLRPARIKLQNKKEVSVSIPDEDEGLEVVEDKAVSANELRESHKVQAKLADIGEKLGLKIWLPRNDRNNILKLWKAKEENLLEDLPLVFDDTTLRTIKNIDVLWIRGRSIVRAFEVEHSTSIYSGILRMADLLALQPMLDIKIHIVAPTERKDEVFRQMRRPVFAVMEKGPLAEYCSFISYEAVADLSKEKRLEHMSDSILDEYSEYSEE